MEGDALTLVALIEAVAIVALAVALAGLAQAHRRTVRGYQRREDDWANRVMHMKGFTWSPPPLDETAPTPEVQYDHIPEPEGV